MKKLFVLTAFMLGSSSYSMHKPKPDIILLPPHLHEFVGSIVSSADILAVKYKVDFIGFFSQRTEDGIRIAELCGLSKKNVFLNIPVNDTKMITQQLSDNEENLCIDEINRLIKQK